ncbi:hypothetical protein GCM10022223_41120 [Kineosporia mesophila]|uniref:Small conductance mechanosensitive channel n=1 Tax=Kineosporia mesophila TaxID=566012 RepID=A0ABP6ZYJ4_9ACTN|nr:mechanosensitive ion channel family protein [Kineosporia mesophila]MCD5348727.1 mechanosensitive ion channel family protein [Kineosporia mesophila]
MFAAPLAAAHTQLYALLSTSTPDPGGSSSPTATVTPTPVPSVTSIGEKALDSLQGGAQSVTCTKDDFSICGLTLRTTGSLRVGQWLDFILGTPLRVAFIIFIGWLVRKIVHRLIGRLAARIAAGTTAPGKSSGGEKSQDADATPAPVTRPMITRRKARSKTLAQVLRSVTSVIIFIVVGLMVMDEIGLPITPLLASFSVIGVALGLGAQSVVRDVLAGMFMILEDQYGVGDSVNVGEATGTVEAVGLRVTQLRDLNGTVWYVRNGEILSVGNSSQGWSRAVVDVNVGFEEDIEHVEDLLEEIGRQVHDDPKFRALIMEDPEIWGVETMAADSVVVRMVVKTLPDQSAPIAREIRRRIRLTFRRDRIVMHSTPRTVIVNSGDPTPPMNPAHGSAATPEGTPSGNPTADSSSKRHPEERELGK